MTPIPAGWVRTLARLGPRTGDDAKWALRIGCKPSDVTELRRQLFGGLDG